MSVTNSPPPTQHTQPPRSPWLRTSLAFRGRYGRLLMAILAVILMAPWIVQSWGWNLALAMLGSTVLVTGVYAVYPGPRALGLGILAALIDVATGQSAALLDLDWLRILQTLLWLLTLIVVAILILESILAGEGASIETLQAATCVYLLIGLIWVFLYSLLEQAHLGEFQYPQSAHWEKTWLDDSSPRAEFLRLLYFSYVTLTTVGYGDITPTGGIARICACLEAITGQLYLAIMIARLVGMHIGQSPGQKE